MQKQLNSDQLPKHGRSHKSPLAPPAPHSIVAALLRSDTLNAQAHTCQTTIPALPQHPQPLTLLSPRSCAARRSAVPPASAAHPAAAQTHLGTPLHCRLHESGVEMNCESAADSSCANSSRHTAPLPSASEREGQQVNAGHGIGPAAVSSCTSGTERHCVGAKHTFNVDASDQHLLTPIDDAEGHLHVRKRDGQQRLREGKGSRIRWSQGSALIVLHILSHMGLSG